MKTRMMIFLGLAGLLVVALFAAGMVAGNSLAQDSGSQTGDAPVAPDGNGVIVKEITIEGGPGEGMGFPFEGALRKMVSDGHLTHEDVDAIMRDLAQLTEAVVYESNTSEDGSMREVHVDVTIDSNSTDSLREAMASTLDKAVSEERLTAEQADAVLAEVDAAPDPLEGMSQVETFSDEYEYSPDISTQLQGLLDDAVAAGSVSESEAVVFLDILERILSE